MEAEVSNGDTTYRKVRETFVIIAYNYSAAEKEAIRRFRNLHDRRGYAGFIQKLVVRCTSTKNACQI